MEVFNLDTIIVIFYLVLVLIIGIYSGKNIKSMKEYAIGDYKFSNTTLMATITATWISAGGLIGTNEKVYEQGIIWVLIFMGDIVEILLFQILAPKLIKFKGLLSAAEIMGKCYGKKARIITGVCVGFLSAGLIGAQIHAMGYLCKEFFHIPPVIGVCIGAGILIIYSSFGGIRSVTVTDVIQFGFFIVALPLMANVLLDKVGGYPALIAKVPPEHLKLFPSYGTKLEYILFFILFSIPMCNPSLLQRVLMAKDAKQIASSFKSTAIVMALFYIICGQIALSILTINPNLESNNVVYYVVNNYLPIGIKGIAIAGLLAVMMSTADSYLNTSSIAFINDVLNPLVSKRLSIKQELSITKIFTVIIGIAAIIVAIKFEGIIRIMFKSWILWVSFVLVPLYGAILGIRSNTKIFFITGAVGFTVAIIWMIFDIEAKTNIESIVPILFVNAAVFLSLAYYYKKYAPSKLNDINYNRNIQTDEWV